MLCLQIQHRPALVRTPEPTPKASPTSSPPRRRSPAVTPRASPRPVSPRPVQQVLEPPEPMILPAPVVEPESEPESSASLDIQEELKRLAGEWFNLCIQMGFPKHMDRISMQLPIVYFNSFAPCVIFHVFLSSADFFQNQFFQNILSCMTLEIRPDILSKYGKC